eukprot:2896640-Pyramimonas_sp.AAC.1
MDLTKDNPNQANCAVQSRRPGVGKTSANILRRLDRAWAAPPASVMMDEGRMGFKIFMHGTNIHTRRLPMAVSNLK